MKNTGLMYHIKCAAGDVGEFCILPGDPGRCKNIAAHFENARLVASNREYVTYTGTLSGVPVSVCSTGIGSPSAAIAMEELSMCGARTFIRVGTCGGIDMDVPAGSLVIASAAIRAEGTSREYVPLEFPAVADLDVTNALCAAARKSGFPYKAGVVHCKDSFYGQHSPETMPAENELSYKWRAWKRAGALASEMESAALFITASTRRLRCGSVFTVVWNQEREAAGIKEEACHDSENAIFCAVSALKILIGENKSHV